MIKKLLKRGLLVLLLIFIFFPYVLPVETTISAQQKPFDNSNFFTTYDDVMLHYRTWQPIDEPIGKILLIHGLGGSTFSYRKNAPALAAAGYYVVAVDLPAFGYSSKKTGLSHDQVSRAKWLWELLYDLDRKMGVTTPWHLAGHSMGGSTVLAMSNQNPNDVASLVLIDPAIVQENASNSWWLYGPIGQWLRVGLKNFFIDQDNLTNLLTSAYGKTPTEPEVKGYLDPLLVTGTNAALVDFVRTAKNVTIDDWKQTQLPTILLWGELDEWVSVADLDKILDVAQVAVAHIFKGAGHCPNETDSSFNDVLIGYLASLNP